MKPISLSKLRTYSIRRRKNLVHIRQFCRLTPPPRNFLAGLPDILAGRDFKHLVEAIARAHQGKHLIGVALGAHVIKCGLSPVIIDLMKRGIINAIAMNGATAIHDYEISLIGATSEDVRENIRDGKFGMAWETAEFFSRAARRVAIYQADGLGEACGKLIQQDRNRYRDYSILAHANRLNIPVTIHVAFGTDTIHLHPSISGADLGQATLRDFEILCSIIADLNKGVWLNIGSAVILPEVFLKAVSVARNLGYRLDNFTTANLDMIQHYRPVMNVTNRPTNQGINLTGHHEIMLPLLRWAVLSELC